MKIIFTFVYELYDKRHMHTAYYTLLHLAGPMNNDEMLSIYL